MQKNCPLTQLNGFSAVTSFPPDVMHDCFEGIIPYFLQFLFLNMANNGFSISRFNEKIQAFNFGATD